MTPSPLCVCIIRNCKFLPCKMTPFPFMMKHFRIRSFHASHRMNLMDNEREYLPWMSDFPSFCNTWYKFTTEEQLLTHADIRRRDHLLATHHACFGATILVLKWIINS
jgi:hypothetical protein